MNPRAVRNEPSVIQSFFNNLLGFVVFFRASRWRWTPLLLLAPAIGATMLLREASSALSKAKSDVQAHSELAFARVAYRAGASLSSQLLPAPPEFESAAFLNGNMCLSGHGGLFCYAAGETHSYLPGAELPPQPLGAMTEGALRADGASKLYIAAGSDGLLIFDGKSFEQLRPEDPKLRHAVALLALRSGRLLIGTEKGGVLAYDGQRLSPLHPALSQLQVTALAGDESELWIGTRQDGAYRFAGGQVQHFQTSEGLPDSQVLSVAFSGDLAAVGTPVGVALFRAGRFERTVATGVFARCLLLGEHTLQIGTQDAGVVTAHLNRVERDHPEKTDSTLTGEVRALVKREDQTYAITSADVWEAPPKGGQWGHSFHFSSTLLSDRNVSTLAAAPDGRLWVGYFDRGLDLVDAPLEHSRHLEDEQIYCVNRIAPGSEGKPTAVATLNGLVLLDSAGVRRQLLDRSTGLIANQIGDVLIDKGRMVAATSAGLTFIDSLGARSLYAFHGLVNNHAGAIAERNGQLLVGTLGGLSLLEGETIKTNYTTANSRMKHNWVTAIAAQDDGWWIGTYGAGIGRLDDRGEWTAEPGQPPGAIVNPNALLATKNALYAGSLGNGLLVYQRASRRWEQRNTSLPSLNVTAIAERQGSLFIGTDNGIVKLSERTLLQ